MQSVKGADKDRFKYYHDKNILIPFINDSRKEYDGSVSTVGTIIPQVHIHNDIRVMWCVVCCVLMMICWKLLVLLEMLAIFPRTKLLLTSKMQHCQVSSNQLI